MLNLSRPLRRRRHHQESKKKKQSMISGEDTAAGVVHRTETFSAERAHRRVGEHPRREARAVDANRTDTGTIRATSRSWRSTARRWGCRSNRVQKQSRKRTVKKRCSFIPIKTALRAQRANSSRLQKRTRCSPRLQSAPGAGKNISLSFSQLLIFKKYHTY